MNSIVINNVLQCSYEYSNGYNTFDGIHFPKDSGNFVSVIERSDKSKKILLHNGSLDLSSIDIADKSPIYTTYIPFKSTLAQYKIPRELLGINQGNLCIEDGVIYCLYDNSVVEVNSMLEFPTARWNKLLVRSNTALLNTMARAIHKQANRDSIRHSLLNFEIEDYSGEASIISLSCNCSV